MWIRSSDIAWLRNCVKSMSSHLPVSSGASAGSLKQVSNASDLVMYVAKGCNLAVLSSKSPPLFPRNDSEILMSRSSACSHDKLLQDFAFLFFRDKYISYYFPDVSNFCWWQSLRTEQHHASVQCRGDPGADKAIQWFLFLEQNPWLQRVNGWNESGRQSIKYSFKVFEDIRRYSCHICNC